MSASKSHPVAVVLSILVIGSALRIWAALAPGALWFDELQTALNVRGRGWEELFEPLGYHQVAPVGFLAAEMVGYGLLGPHDVGLRLFPLLASIASLVLFWRVSTRFVSGLALQGAVALFAVSPALVWYARKAKQYAGDLCVTLILLLVAVRFLEGRRSIRAAWIAGLAGLVAIPFSQPAALVAAGLVVVLGIQTWRERDAWRPLALLGFLWGVGCLIQVTTSLALAPPNTQEFMQQAWTEGFVPPPTQGREALFWLPRELFAFLGFVVALMDPDTAWEVAFLSGYAAFIVLGTLFLLRSRPRLALLLLTPLAVAILAGVLRVLPMNGRLMIYVGPTFLLACLAGVEALRPRLGRGWSAAAIVALVAAPAAFMPFVVSTLNQHEDVEPVLRQVRDRWREGDVAYVYEGADMAMRFYGAPLGLNPWISGRSSGPDPHALLQDVDTLRGHDRAWLFYTHGMGCEPALIQSYLESIGIEIEIDRIDDPHGLRGMHETGARLYDLSDPMRLARSSAATHPSVERGDPRCRGGVSVGARIRDRLRSLTSRFVD